MSTYCNEIGISTKRVDSVDMTETTYDSVDKEE
jgi:hypothetical protein